MTRPTVSVVVVSRGRPDALALCLTGLSQLDYPEFEIVVVADDAGLAQVADLANRTKQVLFNEPNISAARNLGIARAAGMVVAFIDDDAVPEPTWLDHLAQPFTDDAISAAGGYVLGRNGISYQWKARTALSDGTAKDLDLEGSDPRVLHGEPGAAIKTEGTNMAFRRDVLAAMGGFDPAFRFYLDETDLNMRLAEAGQATAVVPRAIVHHGFRGSERRRSDRVPTSLFEIGASLAVFVRRHGSDTDRANARNAERDRQRRRLLRHMVNGGLEPGDVRRILGTFDAGWDDGSARPIAPPPPISTATEPFLRFLGGGKLQHQVIAGRVWRARHLRKRAGACAAEGDRVTLFLFSPTTLRHSVRYRDPGYWEQRGGLFGASDRADPAFRAWKFGNRVRRECDRVAGIRMQK